MWYIYRIYHHKLMYVGSTLALVLKLFLHSILFVSFQTFNRIIIIIITRIQDFFIIYLPKNVSLASVFHEVVNLAAEYLNYCYWIVHNFTTIRPFYMAEYYDTPSFSCEAFTDVPAKCVACWSGICMFLLSAYATLLLVNVLCICRTFSVMGADTGCGCIVRCDARLCPDDDIPLLLLGISITFCTDGEMDAVVIVGAVNEDGEVMLFQGNDCCLSSIDRFKCESQVTNYSNSNMCSWLMTIIEMSIKREKILYTSSNF